MAIFRTGVCVLCLLLVLCVLPVIHSRGHSSYNDIQHSGSGIDPQLLRNLVSPHEIARLIEEEILARRAMLPELICGGLPSLGIPPLDPVSVGDVPVNFTMDVVTLEGNFSEVQLEGLSEVRLTNVHLQLPGMLLQLDMRLPSLVVKGKYLLGGSFSSLISLSGSGPLTLTLTDVDVRLICQVRLYYDRVHIARVDFTIAVANSSVQLVGYLKEVGFEDLAQQFLEDMSGDFLRTAIMRFREDQFPNMVQRANRFLRSFDWRQRLPDAIALFLGFGANSGGGYNAYTPTVTNNNLVDRFLMSLRSHFKNNAFDLPNLDILTKKKFFKWTLNNGVRLLPGKMFGLDSLSSVGDVLISRHNHIFTFNLDLAAYNLKVIFPSQLIVINKNKKFITFAHISRIKINVQLQLDSQYLSLQLTALHIIHIGDIRVELSGLGALEVVAAPVAEYKVNLEQSKRQMARQAAKIGGGLLASALANVDINSLLTDLVNGHVYAVDPGIVFPDQQTNMTARFNNLLSSAMGVNDSGGQAADFGSLLDLFLGGSDDDDQDTDQTLDDLDPDILAEFGLSVDSLSDTNSASNLETNPAINQSMKSTSSTNESLLGNTISATGDVSAVSTESSSLSAASAPGNGRQSDAAASPRATAASSTTPDPLDAIDPDILAAFGLT